MKVDLEICNIPQTLILNTGDTIKVYMKLKNHIEITVVGDDCAHDDVPKIQLELG